MKNASDLLATMGVMLTVLVAVGGALTLVRGSYSKARIQALREDVGDFTVRLKACEEQLVASQAKEVSLKQQVDHLASENGLLTALVTQRGDVAKVLELLSAHHEAAMAGQRRLTQAIEKLAAA